MAQSLHLTTEREMEMEFDDCSKWHHLIFCKELMSDTKNNAICKLCEEPISGCPSYKCLECNFLQHASCNKTIPKYHDFEDTHHLILTEEVGNNGKEEVICLGCGEPVSGPAYKCTIPRCPFLLHKSCTQQSHAIQHPLHLDHTLILRLPSESNRCDACRKGCGGSFFYRCSPCDFDLDLKCISRWQTSADNCYQHAIFPHRKPLQFTCEACGEDSKGIAYQCSVCRVLIHRDCDVFPPTIKVRIHEHSLLRTYSVCRVKKEDPIFCHFCYKKVNTECGAYYCRQCDFIVHLQCTKHWEAEKKDETATINFNEYKVHMVHLVEDSNAREGEVVGPLKMSHYSHPQHELILCYEESQDEKRCEACMLLIIFPPFYSCQHCTFFLHHKCAKLPPTITRGPFHQHPLTVLTRKRSMKEFWCDLCKHTRHGFAYTCNECGCKLDVQCLFIPETLDHKSHHHPLFLAYGTPESCNGCGDARGWFRCTTCLFNLCWKCVTLPFVTRHSCDPHLLKLTYAQEDILGEYYCFICEKERNPNTWLYYCKECDFSAHIYCALKRNRY